MQTIDPNWDKTEQEIEQNAEKLKGKVRKVLDGVFYVIVQILKVVTLVPIIIDAVKKIIGSRCG